jgi:hypothetical protein
LRRKFLNILLTVAFLMVCTSSFSQRQKPKNDSSYDEKPLHFGFSLGFNVMDFKITPSQTYLQADSLYPEVSILISGSFREYHSVKGMSDIL